LLTSRQPGTKARQGFPEARERYNSSKTWKVYSNFESKFINRISHWLGQNPHDLIIFGKVLTDTPRGMLY
jgi:hypothetical protein